MCDASYDLNHGDHNCIQIMNRNSPERSVVSFCGLDGNEKFGIIIVKSIVPAIRRQKLGMCITINFAIDYHWLNYHNTIYSAKLMFKEITSFYFSSITLIIAKSIPQIKSFVS